MLQKRGGVNSIVQVPEFLFYLKSFVGVRIQWLNCFTCNLSIPTRPTYHKGFTELGHIIKISLVCKCVRDCKRCEQKSFPIFTIDGNPLTPSSIFKPLTCRNHFYVSLNSLFYRCALFRPAVVYF